MQAVLLSMITGALVVLIVCSLMLRSSLIDAADALRDDTKAVERQTVKMTAALSRPITFHQPVVCSFPKTDEAALDDALIAPLPKTKGRRK